MPAKRLHVIDGTAMLFRAYFGMNKVAAPDGREVGGVLGFCQSLSRFVRTIRPTHLSVVFDTAEATFRHEIYPAYKANRSEPPDDMVHQFDLTLEATRLLGFRGYMIPGFEADDLMATMAYRSTRAGIRTSLLTPDKDVHQLVSPTVTVIDPKSLTVVDEAEVERRHGVLPERLIDLFALAGDPSDNLPGVTGIGPKGAAALVRAFGDLDAIYANLDQVPLLEIRGAATLARRLEAGRESAYLCRDLIRLRTDAPLSREAMTFGMLRYRGPLPEAEPFFDQLGFHAPLRALSEWARS